MPYSTGDQCGPSALPLPAPPGHSEPAAVFREETVTDPVIWFEDLRLADVATVGGKGANLG